MTTDTPDVLALIASLDEQEGPANYEENDFAAGWHAALHDLREVVLTQRELIEKKASV